MITWKGSPNFDENRKTIDRIVIHWFGEGTLESANTRFQNTSSQVSAHYGISNTRIWQWVKEEHVAYHAGNYTMNQRSIGIEHDGTTTSPISDDTYKTSSKLIADICRRYAIPVDRTHIIKHSEVKATQCPGTLDIDRLINMVREILVPAGENELDKCRLARDSHWNDLMKIKDALMVAGEYSIDNILNRIDSLSKSEMTLGDKDKQLTQVQNELSDISVQLKTKIEEYNQLKDDHEAMGRQIQELGISLNEANHTIEKLQNQTTPTTELSAIELIVKGIIKLFVKG